jgi:hypothetical protein
MLTAFVFTVITEFMSPHCAVWVLRARTVCTQTSRSRSAARIGGLCSSTFGCTSSVQYSCNDFFYQWWKNTLGGFRVVLSSSSHLFLHPMKKSLNVLLCKNTWKWSKRGCRHLFYCSFVKINQICSYYYPVVRSFPSDYLFWCCQNTWTLTGLVHTVSLYRLAI